MAKENGGILPASCFRSQDSAPAQREFQKEDEDKVLLNITVELEDGVVKHIAMMEGDTAESVARRFCTEQRLPDDFIEPLTDHIVANIISISQQDKDITFYPKMRWQPGTEMAPPTKESDQANPHKLRKPYTPVLERRFSDRVHSHTTASKAKYALQQNEKDRTSSSSARDPLPAKARAVYMRLYQRFLIQKKRQDDLKKATMEEYRRRLAAAKTNISKNSMYLTMRRARKAMQFENYGEMLYEEGIDRLVRRIHREQLGREEAEAREMAGCTGSPKISKHAKSLKTDRDRFWIRLLEPNKLAKNYLQELRNEMFEAEFMECSFKPRVNTYEREASLPRTTKTRFKQLYMDADSRRARREQCFGWQDKRIYTFSPKVNDHINPATGIKELPHEGSVFERLLQYTAKLAEKKQKWQQKDVRTVDPVNGQKLYTPRTGRLPTAKRTGFIADLLYNFQWLYNKKRRTKMEKDLAHKQQLAKSGYVTRSSKKVLELSKNRTLHELFDHLDDDKDGIVHLDTAILQNVDKSVLPELDTAKKMAADQALKFEDFAKVMQAAERSRPGWSGIRYCHNLVKQTQQKQKNQVRMNRISRNVTVRKRQFSSSGQWYRMQLAELERRDAKLEGMRKDFQKGEMAECTFSPRLNVNKKKRKKHGRKTGALRGARPPHSTLVEKDEQEVHGFIFREAHGQAWVQGTPASSSQAQQPEGEDTSPMGLLKSLKLIVNNSLDR